MPKLSEISWRKFVIKLRVHGFSGPYREGKRPYAVKDSLVLTIPNPHDGDISVDLLTRILRQAGISRQLVVAGLESGGVLLPTLYGIMIGMLSDALYAFISARRHLIWYVKDLRALNPESVVEHTLNYGDWEDVQELIRIMSAAEVARIFRKQMVTGRQKGNYKKLARNFFTLYFNQHVKVA